MINLIVAVDNNNGIGKDNKIPWRIKSEMNYFRYMTTCKKITLLNDNINLVTSNFVFNQPNDIKFTNYEIMPKGNNLLLVGRKTCYTLPKTMKYRDIYTIQHDRTHFTDELNKMSLTELLNSNLSKYDNIWVIGGSEIYDLFMTKYRHMCKYLFVSTIFNNYNCDTFFNYTKYINKSNSLCNIPFYDDNNLIFKVNVYDIYKEHQELQYHNIISDLLHKNLRKNRTGIDTYSDFGKHMEFDISTTIPLLTTKKTNWKWALEELLFFISGKTDTNILKNKGINIWEGNTNKEFLNNKGLLYKEGDMGPMYGYQWRHFNSSYNGCDNIEGGLDQLQNLITNIKNNPYARDHLLTALNPLQIKEGVLSPCHILAQFYVGENNTLSCHLYQRSADIFLGVPFNIISYTFLTYMIAYLTNLQPNKLIISYGDIHLYENHKEQALNMLDRIPYTFPTLKLVNLDNIKTIDDFTIDNFKIIDYQHHSFIKATMVV